MRLVRKRACVAIIYGYHRVHKFSITCLILARGRRAFVLRVSRPREFVRGWRATAGMCARNVWVCVRFTFLIPARGRRTHRYRDLSDARRRVRVYGETSSEAIPPLSPCSCVCSISTPVRWASLMTIGPGSTVTLPLKGEVSFSVDSRGKNRGDYGQFSADFERKNRGNYVTLNFQKKNL